MLARKGARSLGSHRELTCPNGINPIGRITPKVGFPLKMLCTTVQCHLGIWVSPSPVSAPYLSLFGSTNLNSRSAHLDTELSFFMLTSAGSLRSQLQAEQVAIGRYAEPWKGDERRVRLGTKALVKLVGGML